MYHKKIVNLLFILVLAISMTACQSNKEPKPLNLTMDSIIEMIDTDMTISYQENIMDNDNKNHLKEILSEIQFSPLNDISSIDENTPKKLTMNLENEKNEKIDIYFFENGDTTTVGTNSYQPNKNSKSIYFIIGIEKLYEISNDDFEKIIDILNQ